MSKKVDLFIFSPPKTGSTSLYNILSQHHELNACSIKEPHFFSSNFDRGETWYDQLFDCSKNTMKFEATTNYFGYGYILDRILDYNSKAKFIIILRNPVDRFISLYEHFRIVNILFQSKHDVGWMGIRKDNHYAWDQHKNVGIYINTIKEIYRKIHHSNVILIDYNDYVNKYDQVLRSIIEFLNIKYIYIDNQYDNTILHWKQTVQIDVLSELPYNFTKNLQDFYKPYNDQLETYLNTKFYW